MHWYAIPKGTPGFLITNHQDQDVGMENWTTRKVLSFSETVHDPIREANGGLNDQPHDCLVRRLARDGYAIFGGEPGSNANVKYLLAVPYDLTQTWQRTRDY